MQMPRVGAEESEATRREQGETAAQKNERASSTSRVTVTVSGHPSRPASLLQVEFTSMTFRSSYVQPVLIKLVGKGDEKLTARAKDSWTRLLRAPPVTRALRSSSPPSTRRSRSARWCGASRAIW